jgi:hypothetical protein
MQDKFGDAGQIWGPGKDLGNMGRGQICEAVRFAMHAMQDRFAMRQICDAEQSGLVIETTPPLTRLGRLRD